tara:strand:- start:104 stop:238 length:135 start_codon:yes stop_codon:yes gene_type:complete
MARMAIQLTSGGDSHPQGHLWKSTMTETKAILILSKAILRTGGL